MVSAIRVARRGLALTVLGTCNNDHQARAYRRLFPYEYAVTRRRTIRKLPEIGRWP